MLLDMRLRRNRWALALLASAGLGSFPGALQAIEGVRLFEGTLILPPGHVAEALAELPPAPGVPARDAPALPWPSWRPETGEDPWGEESGEEEPSQLCLREDLEDEGGMRTLEQEVSEI